MMKRRLKLKYKKIQSAAAMAAAIGTGSILTSCANWEPFNPGAVILSAAGYIVAAGLYWIENQIGGKAHHEN